MKIYMNPYVGRLGHEVSVSCDAKKSKLEMICLVGESLIGLGFLAYFIADYLAR